MSLYLTVAVPTPLRRLFEYLPPKMPLPCPQIGARVEVPYGPRKLVGVIMGIADESTYPANKLRHALQILDDTPLLNDDFLSLCQWTADYYQHPIGEVLHAALPVGLRKNNQAKYPHILVWQHTTEGKGLPEHGLKRSKKQQLLHQLLLKHEQLSSEQLKAHGISSTIARAMQTKGLITQTAQTKPRLNSVLEEKGPELTSEQKQALKQIRYHDYATYLLDGTTGSGKTEVYLQAITRVINEGKQALVLVPEIGLTPQTLSRFRARFSILVVELHSNIAEKQRTDNWLRAASGEARVIIGTRLAIFAPLPNLGAIIIDEEHDPSFKQQDGLRYSARDLAVVRAHKCKIPLILGSATPSLESLHNAQTGRYSHLQLTHRAGNAVAPTTLCVDMRKEEKVGVFSQTALTEIKATLVRDEQVLVFINRRGFAPALLCELCGWVASCKACDARLTLHTTPKHLRCHHCNAQKPFPPRCPGCNNTELRPVGSGTARIEEFLSTQFQDTDVIRVDQDTMQRKNAMGELSKKLHQGAPCILVGTQMLAKGHHFPKVTLVILLDIDQALFSGDFRALERLGQQVTQVSGRAGREGLPGKVILQSYQANHPLLELLLAEGYAQYSQTLMQNRQAYRLPPYWHMALLRAESKYSDAANAFLNQAALTISRLLPQAPTHNVLGPLPAMLEKRQDRFRYQLQITCAQRQTLRALLPPLIAELEQNSAGRKVRWSIDVDPIDMS